MANIVCVGCGMMGSNIVNAFLNHDHKVTIVDVDEKNARQYLARGASFSYTLNDSLEDSAFILFSLPNYRIVRKVLEACDATKIKGKIFVNTSSGTPSEVIDLAVYLKGLGAHYIDAKILTYQGEVDTEHACLLYSGEAEAFRTIEASLYALSNPPQFLGEDTIVAAEIIDLVSITSHFGLIYTPLEGISMCKEYDIDINQYIEETVHMLKVLARNFKDKSDEVNIRRILNGSNEPSTYNEITRMMDDAGIDERMNEEWLKSINKSVANHYRKVLNIKTNNYEY